VGARDGDERHAGQPEEREGRRRVEGAADGGEHREPIARTGEVLVEVEVEPAAVRADQGQIELQAVVSNLEACVLGRRLVDAEQALPETVVAGQVDVEARWRIQLDVTVVAVGKRHDRVPVGASEDLGLQRAVGGVVGHVDDQQPPDR
jgi:hypothetical protein